MVLYGTMDARLHESCEAVVCELQPGRHDSPLGENATIVGLVRTDCDNREAAGAVAWLARDALGRVRPKVHSAGVALRGGRLAARGREE